MYIISNAEDLRMKMTVQIATMVGPDNRWFTGEEVDHDPTDTEATLRFITKGEATRFADWWQKRTWCQKIQICEKAKQFLDQKGARYPEAVIA
ncbi:MAG: hypothetical protein WCW56_00105 [Candidatus Paceibacterota bacterium]